MLVELSANTLQEVDGGFTIIKDYLIGKFLDAVVNTATNGTFESAIKSTTVTSAYSNMYPIY